MVIYLIIISINNSGMQLISSNKDRPIDHKTMQSGINQDRQMTKRERKCGKGFSHEDVDNGVKEGLVNLSPNIIRIICVKIGFYDELLVFQDGSSTTKTLKRLHGFVNNFRNILKLRIR